MLKLTTDNHEASLSFLLVYFWR